LKPKVDFFIVGAPKAGTTSLYSYLSQHPEIEMSTIKEPDYFSNEFIEEQSLYYKKESVKSLKNIILFILILRILFEERLVSLICFMRKFQKKYSNIIQVLR